MPKSQKALPVNPLDVRDSVFSVEVLDAANRGCLAVEPVLHAISRANTVARGIAHLLRIAKNNRVEEESSEDGSALRPTTMEALLDLGEVAAELLQMDIASVARWADTHGIRTGRGE